MGYAGAWTGERGRCHRLVCDDQGKPKRCPEPVIASGRLRIGERPDVLAVENPCRNVFAKERNLRC